MGLTLSEAIEELFSVQVLVCRRWSFGSGFQNTEGERGKTDSLCSSFILHALWENYNVFQEYFK